MIDTTPNLRCRRRRRRAGRRHRGHDLARHGSQRAAARPGRTHQALRRRDPAAADQDFDIPDRCWSRASTRRAWSRRPSAASTCRSRAASSAWSTASISTNGCANARHRAGAMRQTGTFERVTRDAAGCRVVHFRATDEPGPSMRATGARPQRDRRRWRQFQRRAPVRCPAPTGSATSRLPRDRARACAGERRLRRQRAATSITRASCRPTSTAGSFRTATP